VRFVGGIFQDLDGKALREAYDRYKKGDERQVTALLSRSGDKVQALVGVSATLVQGGWDARELLREGLARLGARGGGRPELAQGGATGDAAAVENALGALRGAVAAKASVG
jgi:alanyl-tRNA synthetase